MRTCFATVGAVLLSAAFTHGQETPLSRKVSVKYENAGLASVIEDLGRKVGVRIAFGAKLAAAAPNVTCRARNKAAGRILCRILKPRGLRLSLEGGAATVSRRGPYDELKVRREADFAFARKPAVSRAGDRVTVVFETRSFCDCTVVIEDPSGGSGQAPKIVRHLASGVLGMDAPEPFVWNSKKQTLVWDGKNDKGEYVDDKDNMTVRVSLGLKPRFERTLLWSPKKRIGANAPIMVAAPEGMYVYDSLGVEHLRLFNHEGEYVRTVYPFPADRVDKVVGLPKREYPPDGRTLPLKGPTFHQASLLPDCPISKYHGGVAARAMAVRGKRIALAGRSLIRLATDGSSGGRPLRGPVVSFKKNVRGERIIGPNSMAFSPDGKYLYLTGYHWGCGAPVKAGSWHGVYRMEYAKDRPPEVFAGEMTEDGHGSDARHFAVPTCVATDRKGRVYVADYVNDRIQVFNPDGRLLKSLAADKPAWIVVHQVTGEIFAFSWPITGISNDLYRKMMKNNDREAVRLFLRKSTKTLTHYGSFEEPGKKAVYAMPQGRPDFGGRFVLLAPPFRVEIDSWARDFRLWMSPNQHKTTAFEVQQCGSGALGGERNAWASNGIHIFDLRKKKLTVIRDFRGEVAKRFTRSSPPDFSRQRLYFNPGDRKLYVGEDTGFAKSFRDMLRVDPETGRVKRIDLPFDCEDMCFDQDGLAYLRTDKVVVRFDPRTWREIPWDYGELRKRVHYDGHGFGAKNLREAVSALPTPGRRPVNWTMGGMSVSPRGKLAVACCSSSKASTKQRGVKARLGNIVSKPYHPALYPGRRRHGEIHVWDRHGKLVHEDAVAGLTYLHGTWLDEHDNLYVLADSTRAFNGKRYVNGMTGTVMKFKAGKGKIISASKKRAPIPLSRESQPKRPPDVAGGHTGTAWVQGAEWMFGACGWFGFNGGPGGGCDCWSSRFCLDYLARSFVPEIERYSVAILDSNGNLIVRIGRCGNVDDGKPLDPKDGPPNTRSIGGDEVALFHAAYVGTETDRRLFIHDAGNGRILSVKLGYHAEEKIALKDVPDQNRGVAKEEKR